MARNIVLLADGTGNSAAKAFKTNVWRLYQALDLTGGDQIAVFSDGVGTSSFKPFEIIGLALGFGVKRRVLALYKFLCLNYQKGDRIFAFGFSRGAFTTRVLVGLVAREGLVDFKSEEELDRNARAAYRAYGAKAFPSKLPWVVFARFIARRYFNLWNEITGSRTYEQVRPAGDDDRSAKRMRIAFVGVWDTVAAYGLPIDELTRAVAQWVWPIMFGSTGLLDNVERARQAFSIDDERRTFFPIRWDEEPSKLGPGAIDARLLQVWFAGCHANVGGGYPDDRLAHIPLCWMIGEAAESGLRFKTDVVADYWDYASEAGRIYDSRSGLGVFYRYHPRPIKWLVGRGVTPLVDASVVTRMARGCDDYAPVALPEHIDVLTPFGERIAFNGMPGIALTPPDRLPLPAGRERDLPAIERSFQVSLTKLQQQNGGGRRERLALMNDTVWWRRGLYYVLLAIAMLFLAFPLVAGYMTLDIVGQLEQSSNGIISPIIGFIGGFLPSFASPWLDAMARNSIPAAILVALFFILLAVNNVLRTRIADRARAAWNDAAGRNAATLHSGQSDAHRRAALITATASGVGAAALAVSGNYAWPFLAVVCIASLAAFGALSKGYPQHGAGKVPLSLRIARAIREDRRANRLYQTLRKCVLPGVFLALSIGLILLGLNKAVYVVADSGGEFCPEPANQPDPLTKRYPVEKLLAADAEFKTIDMCTDTGSWLQEGVRYEVSIKIDSQWQDGDLCADTLGVYKHSIKHNLATPLKRWWSQPYFKPIARIGPYGSHEYVLEPVDPIFTGTCLNGVLNAELTPKESGELYVYVNDAVLMLPGWTHFFYTHNSGRNAGSAKLRVRRVTVFPEGGPPRSQ
ncbi:MULTISPECIES: DUF2235 domain-containing protein [unclassified Mesorhizobium]|uniref:DUF2235 domain-containing protein n=1 Tax=unclassified Mesorhizobium TaxID=325217 RepID=UPI00086F956A|nr:MULTISPECIES: DUF2235 domain-containing protein [unclassified Mesorhizobium]MBN9253517.1 DUF2235 domain-containing protein [Mesorhizobium sp.]MBN9273526.1 DUF2235 domain-containing protein [Mesorhizobium sp.]ODT20161.1 MAG: hypothetical protein ABS57_02070 [Mesorhizobium sp. SCN 65-12]OJX82053.1 MAG: hypothetical protein BGO93_22760 [Mesorhizobium sp. 65-26]